MGYAKYVGRVGALAVTLGVGVAVATTPGVAYAEPSSTSSSTSDSTSTGKDSTGDTGDKTGNTDTEKKPETKDEADDPEPSTADQEQDSEPGDDDPVVDQEPTDDEGKEEAPAEDEAVTQDEDVADNESETASDTAEKQQLSTRRAAVTPDAGDEVESSDTTKDQSRARFAADSTDDEPVADTSVEPLGAATTSITLSTVAPPAPVAPQGTPTLVNLMADVAAAMLAPLQNLVDHSPIQMPILSAMLVAVRDEIEKLRVRRVDNGATRYSIAQIDPTPNTTAVDPNPNVLVIGVDGTNLSRILDGDNPSFFALMNEGTTAASSIVGHTTVSNPSWTAILTGVWGERTGVINNVFTPWTYDKWPTVFNQLETHNANIQTTAIADWDVINAIAGAGPKYVDKNIYVPHIEGDTDWLATDDAVGAATVAAINSTPEGVPTFLFSYFVGVDENGHMYGGASDKYELAINNVDDNLSQILTAVANWETANPDEGEWTIIVVTDHGHQPQQGFGHGFQTPDETATFVIASGPGFNDGYVNPDYEIVDTTPTVVTLFGATPRADSDGVSLTTLGPGEQPADLHQALKEMIAQNHSPDALTDVALSLRTIFATVPYYIWLLTNDGTIPIPFLGNALYVVTNIPAQIVARLTGVTGASIFPLTPPGKPSWPGQDEEATTLDACSGADASGESLCDSAIVA